MSDLTDMTKLLDTIRGPEDLQALTQDELARLAEEIRQVITHSVSRTGGHLASNLGVVELTLAMHRAFDFHRDRLLWDVGHQCYAHKILTGRVAMFEQLRQEGGLSGFPSPDESDCDPFSVGHAGTSIATALGMALGAQHKGTDEKIVALIGDASIVNGLSFEALNNLGLVKRQLLIVLNDNSMAIDVTQGAMAGFLSKVRLSHTYEDMRKITNRMLDHLPLIGRRMEETLENVKKTLRMAITPSRLFESLNIPYFGPVDGHDTTSLIELFKALGELDRPALLHVYTKKGRGYSPADDDPCKYHSTGPFELNGDSETPTQGVRTFTEAFGDGLVELAARDDKIVALTAAMPDGTGLVKFRQRFNERYYDVGIAESVAVDIAAGMARQGFKPVVCIYSTFLQRSFDQIFQEVSLQNLPVIFCIDRAGAVGNDGRPITASGTSAICGCCRIWSSPLPPTSGRCGNRSIWPLPAETPLRSVIPKKPSRMSRMPHTSLTPSAKARWCAKASRTLSCWRWGRLLVRPLRPRICLSGKASPLPSSMPGLPSRWTSPCWIGFAPGKPS